MTDDDRKRAMTTLLDYAAKTTPELSWSWIYLLRSSSQAVVAEAFTSDDPKVKDAGDQIQALYAKA